MNINYGTPPTRHPVPRSPLLTGITYGVMGLYIVLFWVWIAVIVAPAIVDHLSDAGSLNACTERGLIGAECSELARTQP